MGSKWSVFWDLLLAVDWIPSPQPRPKGPGVTEVGRPDGGAPAREAVAQVAEHRLSRPKICSAELMGPKKGK